MGAADCNHRNLSRSNAGVPDWTAVKKRLARLIH